MGSGNDSALDHQVVPSNGAESKKKVISTPRREERGEERQEKGGWENAGEGIIAIIGEKRENGGGRCRRRTDGLSEPNPHLNEQHHNQGKGLVWRFVSAPREGTPGRALGAGWTRE